MRLIELTANQSTFKSVRFNRTGLSLIVGSRKASPAGDDDGRSYNGVGKSLLVEILHFCLGSNTNSAFQSHLPDWEFTLRFEADGREYVATRSTNKQGTIFLNGQAYKLKAYTETLESFCFDLPDQGNGQLSFRSLIPRFIRRTKADYNDARSTSSDREPYTTLIRNLFLLGIDISLAENKHALRSRQVELESFAKNFKNDPFIREYYTGNKDASLQTKHLEEQIDRYERDLASFSVADDYYQIEQEANELTSQLRGLKNRLVVVENALTNVQKSMQTRADIPRERILHIYAELENAFKRETLKHLEDIEQFHSKLLSNRVARLGQEHSKLSSEQKNLGAEIAMNRPGFRGGSNS